ncbi:MAG: hypothetical protein E7257_03540 [Lachnospiraceae bacterium]|nr:hypothetical protein [Lachnospiraceae bacterium]
MGTRAELDSLARELAYMKSKYSACQKRCDDLEIASQNMKSLQVDYWNYNLEVQSKINSYNQDANKWVGILFDEIEKTKDDFTNCYEKFDAINSSLQKTYEDEVYYKDEILAKDISELERKVRNFKLDDEDDKEGGIFPWL